MRNTHTHFEGDFRMIRQAAALAAVILIAGSAQAAFPDELLYNGGFEIEDSFFPGEPEGWRQIPGGSALWSTEFARTGTRSLGMQGPSAGVFIGFDTFIQDINTGDLYDPAYEYGGPDLTVSGYYLTPVGDPVGPDNEPAFDVVGIKLEFRRDNTSIYESFEFQIADGDTNGEWQYFEIIFPSSMLSPDFPPFATSVTVLPFRFDTTGFFLGEIYWDDLSVTQGAICLPDLNGDGIVDNGDIGAFVQAFLAGDLGADFNGDGILDNGDIGAFVQAFLAGC